jgi:hypothetical protein
MGGRHHSTTFLKLAAAAALLMAVATAPIAVAAESMWLTGEPLKQTLTQKIGITWSNIPLRQAIERLSQSRKVAIMLDRRVDPDQKIELKFDDVPLSEAFQRIASRLGMGTTMLGPVAYIGPKSTTARLRTVSALRNDDANRLAAAVRQRWTKLKPWRWEALTAPRDLVAELAHESGLEVAGSQQIPADLWAAADLPPMSLSDRLTLILAQFYLTFEPATDGLSLRLSPLPERPVLERTYPVAGSPSDVINNLRQQKLLSDADIRVAGNKIVVRGLQEDQEIVNDLVAGRSARKTTVNEGRKVYTLNVPVDKPVGKLLDELGPALKLEIHVDRQAISAAGLSLDKLVQLDVKDVSADELLRAVLEPAGLTFHRRGDVIDVTPK